MRNTHKKIETISNVAVILVAILFGGVLVSRFFFPASPPSQNAGMRRDEITAGTKLPIANIDWSKSDKTLVMALSTKCHFCTESSPFYEKLALRKAGRSDVRLVTLMPQNLEEAQKYLLEHKIQVDEVKRSEPGDSFIRGTPTLILADRTGAVIASWTGKLPPEKEAEVMSKVFGERSGI